MMKIIILLLIIYVCIELDNLMPKPQKKEYYIRVTQQGKERPLCRYSTKSRYTYKEAMRKKEYIKGKDLEVEIVKAVV